MVKYPLTRIASKHQKHMAYSETYKKKSTPLKKDSNFNQIKQKGLNGHHQKLSKK